MVAIAASLSLFLAVLAASVAIFGPAWGRRTALEDRVRSLRPAAAGPAPPARSNGRSATAGLLGLLSGSPWGEAAARELRQADLPLRAGELLLARLLLTVLFFIVPVLLLGNLPMALLISSGGALLGYLTPSLLLNVLRRRRTAKLERQLVEFLPLLASSLRSGFGVQQGFEAAARQLGPPLAEELALVLSDVNLGAPMQKALEDLGLRVANPDLDIIITAILVQRTTGGNLAEVLDKAGQTLLERERVRGDLQTMTAQQRLTGTILSVYPVVVGLALLAIMPAMWSRLFTEPVGQIQLAVALVLQVLGFLAIRRLLRVDY